MRLEVEAKVKILKDQLKEKEELKIAEDAQLQARASVPESDSALIEHERESRQNAEREAKKMQQTLKSVQNQLEKQQKYWNGKFEKDKKEKEELAVLNQKQAVELARVEGGTKILSMALKEAEERLKFVTESNADLVKQLGAGMEGGDGGGCEERSGGGKKRARTEDDGGAHSEREGML